ncbi:hypothetical protein Tco_1195420 [Tanacetum coccineum]
MRSQTSTSDSFGCWVKLRISPMSRSNIVGGKNWLTKACLICSQVAITPGHNSLYQRFVSLTRDDGKKFEFDGVHIGIGILEHTANFNEFSDVLMWIGPRTTIELTVFDHRKVMSFHVEIISKVNRNDSSRESWCYGSVVCPHRTFPDVRPGQAAVRLAAFGSDELEEPDDYSIGPDGYSIGSDGSIESGLGFVSGRSTGLLGRSAGLNCKDFFYERRTEMLRND